MLLTGLLVGLTWAASGQIWAEEETDQDGIERDRAALEAIYFALDGPSWVNNSNWMSDQPHDQWYGVGTDEDGRVVSLVLYSLNLFGSIPVDGPSLRANELRGRIPAEIGQLDRLIGLFLSNNRLSGPIPPELGRLTELRFLRLDGNHLSGSIPAELGQLTNLRSLVLMENALSGPIPPELGKLVNLEQLFLRSNRLSGPIPPELGQLINLRYLDLRFTEVSGPIPPQLGELSMLEGLFFAGVELSGAIPSELRHLTNLRLLSLPAGAGLVGPLPNWLTDLTALTTLRVTDHTIYTGPDAPALQLCAPADAAFQTWLDGLDEASVVDCDALTEEEPLETPTHQRGDRFVGSTETDRQALVALYRATDGANWVNNANWLSERPLDEWYGVTTDDDGRVIELEMYTLADGVYVRSNGLRGQIPPELGQLDQLQSLVLWHNSLSGPIPVELGNLLNLERLGLDRNGLSGSIPVELGRLTKLYNLSLDDNLLSGSIPAELGDLLNLSELFLEGNQLSGPIPAELGNLRRLRSLDLSRNRLSGPIPAELGSLGRLNYMNLGQNQLSGPIPAELRGLRDLSRLYLHHNRLTGPIPAELGSLYNLWQMYLNNNQLSGPLPTDLGYLSRLRELHLGGNIDLTGALPASFTRLSFNTLRLNNTQLCAHAGDTFQAWLSGLGLQEPIVNCPAPAPNRDRQTLLDFYHATGGPDWLFNTNWLSDLPLGEWYGVTTDGYGRVTELVPYTIDGEQPIGSAGSQLTGNGLSGAIPASLGQLEELRWLYVANNPDLSGSLPASLIGAEELSGLWVNGTELCAPVEWEFQAWLRSLDYREGVVNCVAAHDLSDREALSVLYHSTDGPNWIDSTNWLSDRPLDEWYGVTTDGEGRVTELALYMPDWVRPVDSGESRGHGLRGPIPAELGQLNKLQRLDLRNNNLSGPIPAQLGELSELRVLLLDLNWLSGEIPPQLGDLHHLMQLSLSGTNLSEAIPPELGYLSNLVSLRLDRNKLSEDIPVQLSNLSKLKQLRLERNRLSGSIPTELGTLANLQRLSLSDNALSGTIPAQLSDLTELTVLYLGGNELSGAIPAELGSLSRLRQLYLSDSPELSGPLPDSWTGMAALRFLWVDDAPVCVPAEEAFAEWISGIERTSGLVSCDLVDQEPEP